MKIEMVLPALPAAGMEMVAARLTRRLVGRGHSVGITCIEEVGDLGERLQAEGYRVSLVPSPGIRTIFRPAALERWFRTLSPDVVHVHSGSWLKGARAAARAGVPRIVHTVHGLFEHEPKHQWWLKSWAARYTHMIVTVSPLLRDEFRFRLGLPDERLRVISNGVDVHAFSPGPRSQIVRRELNLPPESILVGTVARLEPVKNQRILVDAFAAVAAARPDVFLVLIGEGSLRNDLERRIAELGLSSRVFLFGAAAETAPIYRDLDIFVLPSFTEGTSISILEAMASGLAVIATRVGGNPELLGDGRCGKLVPSGDASALADVLSVLVASSACRRALGQRARERAVECYSEDRVLDEYEAIYRSNDAALPNRPRTEAASCAE